MKYIDSLVVIVIFFTLFYIAGNAVTLFVGGVK